MGRGKRYNPEHKLNIKKVIATIIAVLVIIMLIIIIAKLMKPNNKRQEKKVALAYYSALENDKWGIINSSGETVITPSYDEMVIVPDSEKDVFIVTYDVDYANNTYKTKAINAKGEQLFGEYEQVEAIQNYDKQNSIWYEKGCLRVKKAGKYGLIDLSGKVLLDCEYDDITPILGANNSLITVKDAKQGIVSTIGAKIIENNYTKITTLTDKYEDGYIVKDENNKIGVIGTNKKELLKIEYDDIKNIYSNNTYIAKRDGQWQIVNEGKETATLNFDDATAIDSNGYIIVKKDNNYGLIDAKGTEIIPTQYKNLKNIYQNYYIAEKDTGFGVIDSKNTVKIDFTYKNLTYIKSADMIEGTSEKVETDLFDRNFNLKLSGIVSEINTNKGYMKIRVNSEYKYYNFQFEEKKNTEILAGNTLFLSKQNGKYGYVDKNNVVVINYIYDDATEQNNSGYVAVKKDGKWGAINSKGETVVEPKYTLENNPIVDFIGVWHLAEDVNANYYTK